MSEISPIAKANNNFTHKLFQEFVKSNNENFLFSPLSAHAILSLTYQGAREDTEKAFATVLNLPDRKTTAEQYKDIMFTLKKVSDVTLDIANKIWIRDGYKLKDSFTTLATANFNAEADSINFGDVQESVKEINAWVEEKTHHKIQNIITEDMIDDLTAMYLINAIYFKGDWLKPFKKSNTTKEKFYVSEHETIKIDMMHIHSTFPFDFDRELNAHILKLPYVNKDMFMLIVLPYEETTIREVEQKLVNIDILSLTNDLASGFSVNLSLPKFKIESEFDLKDTLEKMGLGIIFSDFADFSDLLEASMPLKVRKALQKTFIEVNEEGSEAAAATYLEAMFRSGPMTIKADRPFIFYIICKGIVVFIGKVIRPKYED